MKILNFGSLNIDHVYAVEHFAAPGETVSVRSYQKNPGGKGLNQSVALARAGAPVCHAGGIGEDGRHLAALLSAEGVDVTHLVVTDEPTGHAVIQVAPDGQNCILVCAGANGAIPEGYMRSVLSCFGEGDWLLLQNEVAGLSTLLTLAKERGMRVILNPSPITEALLAADLSAVDCFLFNETEGFALTGEREPSAMLNALAERYPRAEIVLTLGADGAFWQADGERTYCPACPVDAVDTTAAGDTFTGYFLAARAEGASPADALSLAARAAAIAVTRPGTAESVPYRHEVG
ncbi:MAG: ribokinase [Clostridia bacterium]|nr:ribokinase [Clostridia bacterium]